MKVRTRSSKKVKDKINVWPSFVDMMSAVSLVFLFVMMFSLAMFIQIKEKTDNISEQRDQLYKKIEQELKPTLGDDVIYEDGILQIKSSLLFKTDSSKLSKKGKEAAKEIGDAFIEVLEDKENREKRRKISADDSPRSDFLGKRRCYRHRDISRRQNFCRRRFLFFGSRRNVRIKGTFGKFAGFRT